MGSIESIEPSLTPPLPLINPKERQGRTSSTNNFELTGEEKAVSRDTLNYASYLKMSPSFL